VRLVQSIPVAVCCATQPDLLFLRRARCLLELHAAATAPCLSRQRSRGVISSRPESSAAEAGPEERTEKEAERERVLAATHASHAEPLSQKEKGSRRRGSGRLVVMPHCASITTFAYACWQLSPAHQDVRGLSARRSKDDRHGVHVGPVDAAAAQCRDPAQKAAVDELVFGLEGGAEAFNAKVTEAFLGSF
jgi:hypothetical protein